MNKLNKLMYNKGLEKEFYKIIAKLIDRISIYTLREVLKVYKRNESKIVQDSPFSDFKNLFKDISNKFKGIVIKVAEKNSTNIVDKIDKIGYDNFKREIKDKFNLNVKQNTRQHIDIKKSLIEEKVQLIKSVAEEYQEQVAQIIYRGISQGDSLDKVSKLISMRAGVSKSRARTIAQDQINKTTFDLQANTWINNNIKYAIWEHNTTGKGARESHKKASGKIFELAKGMYIDGEYIKPAQKINCNCTARPIHPSEEQNYGIDENN